MTDKNPYHPEVENYIKRHSGKWITLGENVSAALSQALYERDQILDHVLREVEARKDELPSGSYDKASDAFVSGQWGAYNAVINIIKKMRNADEHGGK